MHTKNPSGIWREEAKIGKGFAGYPNPEFYTLYTEPILERLEGNISNSKL
jgi:hypothetical protein